MITKIIMPKLGETMEEGTMGKWLKKEGDRISKGEPLFEVTTDKATFEAEAPADGWLRKIIHQEGETVPVIQNVGYIADSMDEEIPVDSPPAQKEIAGAATEISPGVDSQPLPVIEGTKATDRIKISPLARKIAKEKNIDISQIKGTGPGGRITKEDIENIPDQTDTPSEGETLTGMRKIIAERLSQSKREIPHYYLQRSINMTHVLNLRQKLKAKGLSPTPTVTHFLIKACAQALKSYPLLNTTYRSNRLYRHQDINICLAVALEEGLVAPVIKNTDQLDLTQIAKQTAALTQKARKGNLAPTDLGGGTFTISNLGQMGIDSFSAIINPPQVGILAAGSITKRAVVKDDKIVVQDEMWVTLSLDHRVIDGTYGARFLGALIENLETFEI